MSAAHTPGPWSHDEDWVFTDNKEAGKGDIVCLSPSVEGFEHSAKRWIENGRLIAAAPDLLDALIDVIGWVPFGDAWHTGAPSAAVARARSAIAKAKGEQP